MRPARSQRETRAPADLLRASMLGVGGGLRSFAPVTALAAHGKGPLPGAARFIAYGAAAGELVADKLPQMPSRWSARGLTLRLAFSTAGGRELAGPVGGLVAAGAALASAWAGARLRGALAGSPASATAAVAEDALSYGLVLTAVRAL